MFAGSVYYYLIFKILSGKFFISLSDRTSDLKLLLFDLLFLLGLPYLIGHYIFYFYFQSKFLQSGFSQKNKSQLAVIKQIIVVNWYATSVRSRAIHLLKQLAHIYNPLSRSNYQLGHLKQMITKSIKNFIIRYTKYEFIVLFQGKSLQLKASSHIRLARQQQTTRTKVSSQLSSLRVAVRVIRQLLSRHAAITSTVSSTTVSPKIRRSLLAQRKWWKISTPAEPF